MDDLNRINDSARLFARSTAATRDLRFRLAGSLLSMCLLTCGDPPVECERDACRDHCDIQREWCDVVLDGNDCQKEITCRTLPAECTGLADGRCVCLAVEATSICEETPDNGVSVLRRNTNSAR